MVEYHVLVSLHTTPFYFICIFILLTRRKATEALRHRVGNYPDLLPECNFQFCTQGIVIYIFSIYQKSKFFSLHKKFSFSSLQFNHIYLSPHLRINHIYFSVHLQALYMKQIGLFIILKSC